ncbi:MAG: prepilin-type N-terminal cleavage/methylation domain-containing protein [Candidatus Wallbacteria bacterium]|nr:prepilin-type N-terminal cleavage/methylation domain-containing protein [Candidatus Wallbacteria bacterium]
MRRSSGFTLIETVFVMAVVSIVMVVMIQMFSGVQKNVGRAEETLDFLRKASILLDRVRTDIRSAGRGTTVSPSKAATTIKREAPSGKGDSSVEQTITYEFNEEGRFVTRTVKGGKNEGSETFGTSGAKVGFITEFQIASRHPRITVSNGRFTKEVDVEGFYEVRLSFANEEELKMVQGGGKPRSVHSFRALAAKRAPEVRDDLGKRNH